MKKKMTSRAVPAQVEENKVGATIKKGSMSEQYRFLWEPIINAEKKKKKK